MDQCAGAAARLPGSDRKDLAIQALARSETVSDLAARHGVSRKFVYQQTHKARIALTDAFSPAVPDDEGTFARLGAAASWLFSRLFSDRGWMRGLDVEVGEDRG
jgi:hypothetical protein